MKLIEATPENIAAMDSATRLMFAEAQKKEAEARVIAARSSLLRGCAGGIRALCFGGCVWMVCLGITSVTGERTAEQRNRETLAALERRNQDMMSALLTKNREELAGLLDKTIIKTQGTVTGEVKLADGAKVHLDGDMPRPAAAQAASDGKTVVNFVLFHTAPFATGEVQTGWQFKSAQDKKPERQWCTFVENNGSLVGRRVDLGKNGELYNLRDTALRGVDLKAAQGQCVWWSESGPAKRKVQASNE